MKKLLAIGIVGLALLAGCNKTDPTQPQYPPPDNLGEGICLLFSAANNTEFHARLNEYISFHKEMRSQAIYESQRDSEGHATQWIVIVNKIAGVDSTVPVNAMPPAAPATLPVDNKGEITYPK